ncbi:hypothetical protein GCM10027341_15390 [Spirosoma knui]
MTNLDMTDEQIHIVQRTWRLLRPIDPILLSSVFLARLQMEAPAWKLIAQGQPQAEAATLILEFSRIIARLDQPRSINSSLVALVTHYLPDALTPQQVLALGRTMLWTIEQGLGSDWNQSVEQAWRQCYIDLGELLTDVQGNN